MIISFFISAYLVLAFALVAYFSHLIDPRLLNPLDRSLLDFLHAPKSRFEAARQAAVQKACLAFSDTQVVTGLSILIAGFIQLSDISVYHFNIVTYMAWLASNVHVSLTPCDPALSISSCL